MVRKDRTIHICVVASSGGHLTQLLQIREAWSEFPACYASTSQISLNSLELKGRAYLIEEASRKRVLKTLITLLQCCWIIFRERPNVVISSGSGSGCLMCIIGKLSGAKIVWLDSIANAACLSLSGRIIRPFADLCLSQWPEVAKKYKGVEYLGTVI